MGNIDVLVSDCCRAETYMKAVCGNCGNPCLRTERVELDADDDARDEELLDEINN